MFVHGEKISSNQRINSRIQISDITTRKKVFRPRSAAQYKSAQESKSCKRHRRGRSVARLVRGVPTTRRASAKAAELPVLANQNSHHWSFSATRTTPARSEKKTLTEEEAGGSDGGRWWQGERRESDERETREEKGYCCREGHGEEEEKRGLTNLVP